MSLKMALRSSVAAACIVSVVATPGLAEPPAAAASRASGMEVRVASAATFSRIEISGARTSARREGQVVVLSFDRSGDPDISRLRTAPPRWIKSAEMVRAGGRMQLRVTLADDAEVKLGQADGAFYLNAFAKPEPVEPSPEAAAAGPPVEIAEGEPVRPDPLPPGGVVPVKTLVAGPQVQIQTTWANPAGAAVFWRGDVLWVVFDAPAKLAVGPTPRGVRGLRNIRAVRGEDYSALRIESDPAAPISVEAAGNTWTLSFGPGAAPTAIKVARDDAGGPAALKAAVAGATRSINLPDPEVGDVVQVVTALGPTKGLPARREFVDVALLPSLQGLAIESRSTDVTVQRDGDLVRIGRPQGLALTPLWAARGATETAASGMPRPASMPALIDESWGATGPGGFLKRYAQLVTAAAQEGSDRKPDAPVEARKALARFLLGSGLSFEAIGVLNDLARAQPALLDDAEFRGMRGVARVLARRYAEADTDLSSPALADEPSSNLWRSYVDNRLSHHADTREAFAKGAQAYRLMPALWRARFARADAESALLTGDLAQAEARLRMALEEKVPAEEQLQTRLVQARLFELQNQKDRALRVYAAIAKAPMDGLSAPATLRATRIRMELGQINAAQAAQVFDGLRYRWRGDGTELETIRALGQLYLAQGRYREALEALRSAGVRMQNLPEAQQIQADLGSSFRALFLDGLADGLEPVQALALFVDFKELTPLGADGDMMVRKMVRRLIDVDLLPQAAELLKYQAENRLDGVPRAQVSTDLALIYLMDRKPEAALEAINSSRTTILPTALNTERRLIEARAWTALGRYDSALEILQRDPSRDAEELRAEVTWKQKDWAVAGPLFEKSLGERWKNNAALSRDEEGRLIRAGVSYSLAGNDAALARLQQRYQGFYDTAGNPEALRVALSGEPSGPLTASDFGRVSADSAAFAGWVEKMKGRFKTRPAPVGPAKAAPARQAQAASPPVTKG